MKTIKTKAIKAVAAGLFAVTLILPGGTAQAASDTWTGATSPNWGDANWTGANNPPASGDSLVFTSATGAGGTALNNNLTSSAFNLAGINFSFGAPAFTVSGNTFALTGPITNSSTSLETINVPISMTSVQFFSPTNGGGSLLLGGNLSGTGGGLTNIGLGTLTLAGTNTYTGGTTVNAGKLLLGSASALPGATVLTVNNGGTLDLNGNNAAIGSFGAGGLLGLITNSAAGGSTLTVSNWNTGLKTLVADGANGPVAINFVSLGSVSGGSLGNNTNTFSGGVNIGNAVSGTGYARLGLGGTVVNGTPGNIISSAFGRGTITIGNAATDRSQVYINVGSCTILNNVVVNSAVGADRTGAFRVDGGGLILWGTLTANLAPVTLSCNSAGNTAFLNGQITGTNGFWLRFNGSDPSGYLIVTMSNVTANANNYRGSTEIDNPFILVTGATNQIPSGANASDVTNNGTIKLNGNSQTVNGLWGVGTIDGISGTPTLTIGANNESSTNGCVIKNTLGTLSLKKTGTGIAQFTGVLSYNGNTTVSGGILSLQQPNFPSSSTITIASGATLDLPNGGTFAVANLIINGVAQPNGTYNSTTDPGYITGSGQVTVTGGSASDTWTGATSANWSESNWTGGRNPPISGDTINFTSATGVGGTSLNDDLTSSSFQLAGINYGSNAAPFTVNGNAFTLAGAITDNSASPQTINNSFAVASVETITTTNSGGSLTLGGSLSGPGGVTTAGLGTLVLSGANSYAGATTIGAGTLLLGNAAALPSTTTLLLANGGILDLSSNGGSIATFSGSSGYGSLITNSASGTNVVTLTVSDWSAGLDSLVVDGATAPVALSLQSVGNAFGGSLNNNTNTFSGGITIGNSVSGSGYERFQLATVPISKGVPGNIISSPFGRGPITIGNLTSDKAQLWLDAGTTFTILNNIIFNTTLGADRVGAVRVDQGTAVFGGTLTASNAPVNFACNSGPPNVNAVVVAGQITGPYGLWLQYNGSSPTAVLTVTLSNVTASANNYQGDTEVDTPHVLALGAANQIPCGPTAGNLLLSGTFELNGHDQTINGLANNGIVDGMSGTPTLTVGDNDAYSEFDGVIQNSAGSLSLAKIGVGAEDLTGTNTYTGNTLVEAGTLEIAQPCLFAGSTVSVASGATLQMDFATTNQVEALVLNGVSQPPGVYNSATSPSYLAGPGSLLVAAAYPTAPTTINFSASPGSMTISWPSGYLGWILQQNTNSLTNPSAWYDVPGSGSITSTNLPVNQAIKTVFYRLRYP